jgi:septal ring factor EnvC (AmiA/AmiB activator)
MPRNDEEQALQALLKIIKKRNTIDKRIEKLRKERRAIQHKLAEFEGKLAEFEGKLAEIGVKLVQLEDEREGLQGLHNV